MILIPTGAFLIEFNSNSEQETFDLGQRIASHLGQGAVAAIQGELGSGKTTLVKGIASGLGILETITSPTYTIVNEYEQMYHIDAYRLSGEDDFEEIGGSEILNSGKISVIEWSGRIKKALGGKTIFINIEITGPSSRLIKIKGASFNL